MGQAGRTGNGDLVQPVDRIGDARIGAVGVGVNAISAGAGDELRGRIAGEVEGQIGAGADQIMVEIGQPRDGVIAVARAGAIAAGEEGAPASGAKVAKVTKVTKVTVRRLKEVISPRKDGRWNH